MSAEFFAAALRKHPHGLGLRCLSSGILSLAVWCLVLPSVFSTVAAEELRGTERDRLLSRLGAMRVPFVANAGQADPAVAYSAQTFAGTVFVTNDGRIVYSLPAGDSGAKRGWSLTETLVGGRSSPSGRDPSSAHVSYFLGNDPARWTSGVETFDGVSLGAVWPGISLELRARGKNVEKVFTIEPGGDPARIRMRITGARRLTVNAEGALIAATGLGEVTFTPPAAYQEVRGKRHPVEAAYQVRGRQYGFLLGDYDRNLPVMIDPLLQSTYLGGGDTDVASAIAIHPTSDEVYVAGRTLSTNFPGTAGGAKITNSGGLDVFIARLNPALTTLNQATYVGGSGADVAYSIAIHPVSGDVYVAGYTLSTNFPGTSGGAQAASGGGQDAFVARLNAALTTLNQATYFGGSGSDTAEALAIHPTSGNVYVVGNTGSTNLAGTAGGFQTSSGGGDDAFVARWNAALTTLNQATYFGGSGVDELYGLAIHPTTGDVYVAGRTTSTSLPGTAGGAQPAHGGFQDAFVARFNTALTAVNQATYLGGSGGQGAFAAAIHPITNEVYVAGYTSSSDFPGTAGGAQAVRGGFDDAFVARLNVTLTKLNQATYLGGDLSDHAEALAIHPTTGEVYVAGYTFASNFPGTTGGAQSSNGGFEDAFIARLAPTLTSLTQATYLGGGDLDDAQAMVIHPSSGQVYVAGTTASTDLPGKAGGPQATKAAGLDGFLARLTSNLALAQQPVCNADSTTLCLNASRFKAQVQWATPQGQSGAGQAVSLTSDTGYFWFFSANNVEMVVKVVDGRAVNNRFWVFAAGLTNVNVVITVTDIVTGTVKTYTNPQSTAFQPIQDTAAFATVPEGSIAAPVEASFSRDVGPLSAGRSPFLERFEEVSAAQSAPCAADSTTLCLNNGRFRVQVQWGTPQGQSGAGQAVGLTSDTGYFWFFSSNNVEMVLKVVTGCPLNSRFWVFAGGLTNVNAVMTVTDTQTGALKTYTNPQSTAFQPIQDTAAFATCP